MPKAHISIITVSYNAAEQIGNTIESVISQRDVIAEYIITDGQSMDGTQEIVRSFGTKIHQFISEEDDGIYDAMNKGLRLANGTHIMFLNAGDTFTSTSALKELLSLHADADLYCGETNLIDESGKVIGTRSEKTSRKLPAVLSKKSFLNGQIVSHQAFLARRALCPEYDLQYRCSADTDWMIKIASKAATVAINPQPTINYLVGGFSEVNLTNCWKERLQIMLKHFNPFLVFLYHIKFGLRFLIYGIYKNR